MSRTIIQSVVRIGRVLGMDIVAEGVETEFEALMMTRFGCTELQGYYFSKPIDADQMHELLHTFQPKHLTPALVGKTWGKAEDWLLLKNDDDEFIEARL